MTQTLKCWHAVEPFSSEGFCTLQPSKLLSVCHCLCPLIHSRLNSDLSRGPQRSLPRAGPLASCSFCLREWYSLWPPWCPWLLVSCFQGSISSLASLHLVLESGETVQRNEWMSGHRPGLQLTYTGVPPGGGMACALSWWTELSINCRTMLELMGGALPLTARGDRLGSLS